MLWAKVARQLVLLRAHLAVYLVVGKCDPLVSVVCPKFVRDAVARKVATRELYLVNTKRSVSHLDYQKQQGKATEVGPLQKHPKSMSAISSTLDTTSVR